MRNKKTINELRTLVRSILAEAATPQRVRFRMNLPEDLLELHEMMKASGEELYVVGGAVRDVLMDKEPKDYDLTTGASPERVMDILSQDESLKLDVTGKMFGVVRAWTPEGNEYEIATFRKETYNTGDLEAFVRFLERNDVDKNEIEKFKSMSMK